MLALIGIFFFFGLITLHAVCRGYALSILWGWFIVPVFNLPQLHVATAIGLALVVGYLTKQDSNCKEKDDDKSTSAKFVEAAFNAVMEPTVILFVGWIIRQFL